MGGWEFAVVEGPRDNKGVQGEPPDFLEPSSALPHRADVQLARQTPVPQMGQAAAPARGALCRLGYGVVPFGNRGVARPKPPERPHTVPPLSHRLIRVRDLRRHRTVLSFHFARLAAIAPGSSDDFRRDADLRTLIFQRQCSLQGTGRPACGTSAKQHRALVAFSPVDWRGEEEDREVGGRRTGATTETAAIGRRRPSGLLLRCWYFPPLRAARLQRTCGGGFRTHSPIHGRS